MLTATEIYIQYGDRVLLDHINLVVGERDRVGLVGRNGAGKSTLLKVLAGEIRPDEGRVARPSASTMGYLHQEMELPKGRTVLDETLTAFADLIALENRLAELTNEIAERTDYDSPGYSHLLEDFDLTNHRFQVLGGVNMEAESEKVLKGLGFKDKDFNRLTDEFSGGWQMRIELAKMLLQRPDYLLLDEPTNHLDIESIIWLEGFLQSYSGAIVLISHDKLFLDNITNRTVEIELGKVYDYKASYSKYVEMRAERREKLQSSFENQQKVIAQKERTINRFMAKATKTKMAQSMQRQLDKMERVEMDQEDTAAMNIRFPPSPRSGQVVVEAKKISKNYGDLQVLQNVDFKLDRGDRVAFVGQNGQGKTTLARILVNMLPKSSGELILGHNVQIGYYAQNQSDTLQSNLTLLETMEKFSPPEMSTRLRAILGAFLFSGEDAEKKVSVLSGGERARLALACMLLRPFNLLVLDEPTNHLDMLSKDILKKALMEYDGSLIVVSHDREFLGGLTNRTIEFRDKHLYEYLGDVNFFLEKRKVSDMRMLEMASQSGRPGGVTPKPELTFEERKRMMRAVSNAEKKVESLESDISSMESQLADPEFYSRPDSPALMEKYNLLKKELEIAMGEWEQAQMEWEEAQ